MLERFRTVGRATKIPILIYNAVPWSYFSPVLLIKILKEVPQVVGVKQSAGDMKLLAGFRVGALRTARRLHEKLQAPYNALIDDNLPAMMKFALSGQGVPEGYSRAPMPAASSGL